MKIVHADELQWGPIASGHRDKLTDEVKYLMTGKSGSKQNYQFLLARNTTRSTSPRHKHNFEQVRYCFEGAFGDGASHIIKQGEVGYYPEGVPYAIDCESAIVMLIQFGGPSGHGYVNHEELAGYFPQMAEQGTFENGKFLSNADAAEGKTKRQDGFEAMWEFVKKKPVEYPRGRYKRPFEIRTSAVPSLPVPDQPSVHHKLYGVFNERRVEVAEHLLDPGATLDLGVEAAPRLMIVLEGEGDLAGETIRKFTAIELDTGEIATISSSKGLRIFSLRLPRFSEIELQNGQAQISNVKEMA